MRRRYKSFKKSNSILELRCIISNFTAQWRCSKVDQVEESMIWRWVMGMIWRWVMWDEWFEGGWWDDLKVGDGDDLKWVTGCPTREAESNQKTEQRCKDPWTTCSSARGQRARQPTLTGEDGRCRWGKLGMTVEWMWGFILGRQKTTEALIRSE